jgi:hypothetical protein
MKEEDDFANLAAQKLQKQRKKMTPDTATRAAERIEDRRRNSKVLGSPTTEEIASILRPFMETKEDKDEKEAMQIIGATLVHFRDLARALSEESKRKDEEIAKVKKMLEDLCDIIEKNKSIHIWETRNRAMLAKKELKLMNPPDDGKTLERGEM